MTSPHENKIKTFPEISGDFSLLRTWLALNCVSTGLCATKVAYEKADKIIPVLKRSDPNWRHAVGSALDS